MQDPVKFGGLPFNLEDLIHRRAIENNRVEYKATWDEHIKAAVIRSICAFANDLLNLNGGYIILGIAEDAGRPVLPPRGLDELDLDRLQREIRGLCKRIQPEFQPVLFPALYLDKAILIIWAPGGDNRPYEAPEDISRKGSAKKYFVRQGPESVESRGEILRQLLESAAKVPFDDRRNLQARLEALSPILVRRFLNDVRSDLVSSDRQIDDIELYRRLRIVSQVNDHEVPRNVSLMFFNEDPDQFFPGARVEVVQFGDGAGGDLIEERSFRGPLPEQIKGALEYLDRLGGTLVQKVKGRAEAERTAAYPYEAMEEAIVNAVYHRGYDGPREPTKIYLYPDRMEIISYPGPVPGIKREHFIVGGPSAVAPARNRRIGDLLKELRLAEGRGTGIPKIQRRMLENGSPQAQFDFDDDRTYFRVVLPVHPRYHVLHALREAGQFWAMGSRSQALDHLLRAFEEQPTSGALASQLIEYAFGIDNIQLAKEVLDRFESQVNVSEPFRPYLTMGRLLIDRGRNKEGLAVLNRSGATRPLDEELEAIILRKRAGEFSDDSHRAHLIFEHYYLSKPDDPPLIHEFAQTKIALAQDIQDPARRTELYREAAALLRQAIQLSDNDNHKAWYWFDLARTLNRLGASKGEVDAAILRARSLLPQETRFEDWYRDWRQRQAIDIPNH